MENARELLVHELNDMLDAEQNILPALEEQIQECQREDLRKLLESHHTQTQTQVERLQECLDEIGEEPEETECHGIRGIIQEHKSFKEEQDPSPELLETFNVGAATKVEHYEIAAYNSLIEMCNKLGLKKATRLLNQNLKEEEQMLKRVESLSKKMKPSMTGMEEEEEQMEEMKEGSRPRARGRKAA